MIFSDINFIFFLFPLLILIYFSSKVLFRNYILILFSILFYAIGDGIYVIILLLVILFNYIIIKFIYLKINNHKIIISVGVFFNLSILAFFKYGNFLVENLNIFLYNLFEFKLEYIDFRNPIGISFYIFQSISLILDISRNNKRINSDLTSISLYILLFPQLIAGPIVRYKDLVLQISGRVSSIDDFVIGFRRFIVGLSKKVLIADSLAPFVNQCFLIEGQLGLTEAWVCILAFSFQLYFDFSGYSDMAIGLCRVFGFRLNENFNHPYQSSTMQNLWSRWHISLTQWFRDYLFLNLRSILKKLKLNNYYLAIMVNFTLIGFWHGASWCFLCFGFAHGLVIIVERKLRLKKILDDNRLIGTIYTQIIWLTLMPLFAIGDLDIAIRFIYSMYTNAKSFETSASYNNEFIIVMIFAFIYSFFYSNIKDKVKRIIINTNCNYVAHVIADLFLILLFVISISRMSATTFNPFIYFKF